MAIEKKELARILGNLQGDLGKRKEMLLEQNGCEGIKNKIIESANLILGLSVEDLIKLGVDKNLNLFENDRTVWELLRQGKHKDAKKVQGYTENYLLQPFHVDYESWSLLQSIIPRLGPQLLYAPLNSLLISDDVVNAFIVQLDVGIMDSRELQYHQEIMSKLNLKQSFSPCIWKYQ